MTRISRRMSRTHTRGKLKYDRSPTESQPKRDLNQELIGFSLIHCDDLEVVASRLQH